MITAVDTNILVDVFTPDEIHGLQSKRLLADAYDAGEILVCDVVYAELVPAFDSRALLDSALHEIGAALSPNQFINSLRSGPCVGSDTAQPAEHGRGLQRTF